MIILSGQCFYFLGLLAILSVGIVADELPFTRDVDLIYHKEGGYALTMDRVAPVADANGAAVWHPLYRTSCRRSSLGATSAGHTLEWCFRRQFTRSCLYTA